MKKRNSVKITVIRERNFYNKNNSAIVLIKKTSITPDGVLLERGKIYSNLFTSCNLR